MLCFVARHRHCEFHTWKLCGGAASSTALRTVVLAAFAHTGLPLQSDNPLNISAFVIIIVFFRVNYDKWSLMLLLWFFFWGATNHTCVRWQMLDKCVYSDSSINWCSPMSLPFLGPSHSLRHSSIEIRPVNTYCCSTLQNASRYSGTFIFLYEILESCI